MTDIQHNIVVRKIDTLRPYAGNPRTHSKKQIKQLAKSIKRFGFINPAIITTDGEIIAGYARVEALRTLGLTEVPTIEVSHLSEAEKRAYILADNKLAANAGWDKELLAIELKDLIDLDFDLDIAGFEIAEVDIILDEVADSKPKGAGSDDAIPNISGRAVTRLGDVWKLGRHLLFCADARDAEIYGCLRVGPPVAMLFTDPPYNVQIDGNVCGSGSIRHREFAFASGEMSEQEFTDFLSETLVNAASVLRDGAIAYVCMDWRHMGEMLAAGKAAFTELKNVVVWNKTNGGMGSFYRSKHELIFVFKNGTASHTNNFGLGETGRPRTNVWDYAGISSMSAKRGEELAMHPTVKPVELIADAIRDCSKRGEIILDCFGGSGSTLIAAEKTGRIARVIEIDPLFCDVIVRRWQLQTGKQATPFGSDMSFEEIADLRSLEQAAPRQLEEAA